ncbi:hypothetical protein [Actinomadura algeriensis]|uniref:DUF3558 domain-containing protein n=1 Tax=Actinomadura algeriensis TaxID=1679523 RepID=A0ABR9JTG9_9ACTN|nr:hypothetical protein [Actinomadura algeriensis]MBE1533867.1 hypothetical protein [Actinomadura algeriensis]
MTGTGNRPRWLPHASAAAGAALVTAAVVFGLAHLRDSEPVRRPTAPDATASPAASAAPAHPAPVPSSANPGPDPLTALPDPCALVTAVTFDELALRAKASGSGRERRVSDGADTAYCEWTGGDGGAGGASDRRSLRSLRVSAVRYGTREKAIDSMEFERGITRNLSNTVTGGSAGDPESRTGPYREVPGIGGEAFAQSAVQDDRVFATVWTRYENVTLKIVHGAAAAPGEAARAVPSLDAAAERAARRAVAAIAG